jgi:hypothetical protein
MFLNLQFRGIARALAARGGSGLAAGACAQGRISRADYLFAGHRV